MTFTALVLWGILVGFVAWAAFPRLPGTIVERLFRFRPDATKLKGIAMLLVAAFLLTSVFLLISLMPMLFMVVHGASGSRTMSWRDMFGVTFMSSLAGFVVHGVLRRFGRAKD